MTQPRDEMGRFLPAEGEEKAESWGDALGEAWDGAESDDTDAADDRPEAVEAQEPEGEPSAENEPAETGEEDDPGSGEAPTDGPSASVVEPPEHWSADDKARFAALPAESKEWFLGVRKQIERGAQEKFDQAAEARRLAGDLEQVLAPVRAQMAPGITPAHLLHQYVQLHNTANTNLGGALSMLARGYGAAVAGTSQAHEIVRQVAQALSVDLSGLDGQAGAADEGWIDPQAHAVTSTLKRELDALKAEIQRRDQAQQHETLSRTQAVIQEFREAKTADGSLAHPHFDKLSTHMGALMQAGAARDLEDAYSQAEWASPELRSELLKRQDEERARAREAQRKASVAKAKAASTPKTRNEAVTERPPERSLKDELAAQFESAAA